jgi:hypothetical protein
VPFSSLTHDRALLAIRPGRSARLAMLITAAVLVWGTFAADLMITRVNLAILYYVPLVLIFRATGRRWLWPCVVLFIVLNYMGLHWRRQRSIRRSRTSNDTGSSTAP